MPTAPVLDSTDSQRSVGQKHRGRLPLMQRIPDGFAQRRLGIRSIGELLDVFAQRVHQLRRLLFAQLLTLGSVERALACFDQFCSGGRACLSQVQ